jgi:CYTH domain-containing protein
VPIEIERKFLVNVDQLPPLPEGKRLVQGYLSKHPQVRFRVTGSTVVVAIKQKLDECARFELETVRENVSDADLQTLYSLALWPPLVKTRHEIPLNGLVWEVDVYEDENAGLVTVDVELPTADHPIVFPDWVIPTDISGVKCYKNINLTQHPYRTWER